MPEWNILRDFETGTIGSTASGQPDGFTNDAALSVYTNEQVYSGSQACKMTITGGTTGFGQWGGVINFPTSCHDGDTLWIDYAMYFPESFDLEAMRLNAKFVRVNTFDALGGNAGFHNLYLNSSVGTGAMLRWIKEVEDLWYPMGLWADLVKNTWHRFSICLRFGSVSKTLGGTGEFKVWRNGSLLRAEPSIKSLNSSTDYASKFYVHTYWNLTAPYTMSNYVDMIRLAKNGVPSWALDLEGVT